jgi:hypothetical protein
MQPDGNLVLYWRQPNGVEIDLWSSGTQGTSATTLRWKAPRQINPFSIIKDYVTQLELVGSGISRVVATFFHPTNNTNTGLAVQNDGNLVIYQSGVAKWDTGTWTDPRIRNSFVGDRFALEQSAWLKIDKPGRYSFYLTSDDGSILRINDRVVVNNDGIHDAQTMPAQIDLAVGFHRVNLRYFDWTGGIDTLRLEWESTSAGIGRGTIPTSVLYRLPRAVGTRGHREQQATPPRPTPRPALGARERPAPRGSAWQTPRLLAEPARELAGRARDTAELRALAGTAAMAERSATMGRVQPFSTR